MSELPSTVADMTRALREGDVSSRELVEHSLERITATGDLNAFLTVCAERALDEARRVDAVRPADRVGALAGIPIAVKDLHETAGVRTTYGSVRFAENVPEEDCAVVARLRRAGAIVIGKTNTPAFGLISETKNRLAPPCANPRDPTRTAGGSSGGSAVAVAVEAVALATGSDAAGSINVPAAFCGVVGFKPSLGVVANVPASSALLAFISSGPITRTVQDAAIAMDVLAGYDAHDPMSLVGAATGFAAALKRPIARGLRVAFSADLGSFRVDEALAAAVVSAADQLRGPGAVVEQAHPQFDDPLELYVGLYVPDSRQAGFDDPSTWEELYPESLAELRDRPAQSAEQYAQLLNRWWALKATSREFFTRHDILLVPTTATTAFAHDTMPTSIAQSAVDPVWTSWMPFTPIFNMTGQPCANVPMGVSEDGLPLGVLVVGDVGADELVLRVARELVGA